MPAREVVRQLRLITSPEWRRQEHFPITVLAQITGLSRQTIYQARMGYGLTDSVVKALEPFLAEIVQGKLKAQVATDRWRVIRDGMEERQFCAYTERLRLAVRRYEQQQPGERALTRSPTTTK